MAGEPLTLNTVPKIIAPDPQDIIDNPQLLADWVYAVAIEVEKNVQTEITASNGVILVGTDIQHEDTSEITDQDTEGAQVVDAITFDTFGHVLSFSTRDLTAEDIDAEPAFEKNTAFNKDFGTLAGEIAAAEDVLSGSYWDGESVETTADFTISGGLVVGDPGFEGSGITVHGSLFNSTFKVSDIGGTNPAQTILHRHSTTLPPAIVGARSHSNTSSHAIVVDGDNLLDIFALGHDGTDYEIAASIRAEVDGTPGNDDMPGRWVIATTPSGGFIPIDAVEVDSSQNMKLLVNPLEITEGGTGARTAAAALTNLGASPISKLFQAQKTSSQTSTTSWADVAAWATADIEDSIYSFNATTGVLTLNQIGWYELAGHYLAEQAANDRIEGAIKFVDSSGDVAGALDRQYMIRSSVYTQGTAQISSFFYQVTSIGETLKLQIEHIGAANDLIAAKFTVKQLKDLT